MSRNEWINLKPETIKNGPDFINGIVLVLVNAIDPNRQTNEMNYLYQWAVSMQTF